MKVGQVANLYDIIYGESSRKQSGAIVEYLPGEGNETPYVDSSDDEDSFHEEWSGWELMRHESKFPRFDRKAKVPTFTLGMKFSRRHLFKDVIIWYGLAERKVIKFIKDDEDRIRAKCDWPKCPWFCLLATTTRT